MTHGVTTNSSAEAVTLARLIGGISTLQSLPLIPSGYALTISSAGSVAAADAQISSQAAAPAASGVRPAAPTAAAPLFDAAVVQAAPRLELAA